MGYFLDIAGLFLLRDQSYKNVGNDRRAFTKYLMALFIVVYLVELFIGISLIIGLNFLAPEKLFLVLNHVFLVLLLFLLAPLLYFIITYIFTLILHLIGLAFGGKPNNYHDFFKVVNYVQPIIIPFTVFFGKIAEPVFTVWSFFILYRTYKNIHRLSPGRSVGAVVVLIVLIMIFAFLGLALIFYIGADNPQFLEEVLRQA
jgi:hypothetical protein